MEASSNANQHLGGAELARMLEESRREAGSARDTADLHPHLAVCSACREQFEELASLDRQLMSMRAQEEASHREGCPDEAVWREIAGGLIPPDLVLASVEHASRCDHCGPLLRAGMAEFVDLNKPVSEREQAYLADFESAKPEWRQRLAHQMAATQREPATWWQKGLKSLNPPRTAMAAALVVAVAAGGSWVVVRSVMQRNAQRNQPADARQLLARAYTEKRSFELRIAGAAYAPVRVLRGPAGSFTSDPTALTNAKALIASQLESHPADPAWLQAKAQADLLDGDNDAAVEALRRALELEPDSPGLRVDLATACFQRAQSGKKGKDDDVAAAYEYLSQALKLSPDDPVALFNRAVVAEHESLYHQALDDWERYLQVDAGSGWAGEARDAAARLRAKLSEHDAGQAAPLLSPAQMADSAGDPKLGAAVDARIEEYLSEAVRSWLPQGYPEQGSADRAAQGAIFFLAELTSQRHDDSWVSDLLRTSSGANFPRAAGALARAFKANGAGEYNVSRRQSQLAEELFRASGNTAGVLRARFEQSFAEQMSKRGKDCRRLATAALRESERHNYPWLQIQLGLEKGDCSGLMGDLGADESGVRRAVERASASGYGALYLRALGFLAGDQREAGNAAEGWKLVSAGLDGYWSGQFPALRGYNAYTELAHMAEDTGRPYLQMAAWREAAALIESGDNVLRRAWAHDYLATAASAVHRPEIAERQYAEAARLFELAPRTEASHSYVLETEIRTARVEASLNRYDAAMARLTSIQSEVRPLSNNYLPQMFYSTLGEVRLRSHHAAEAERAFDLALSLDEKNLASLTSEMDRMRWSQDAAPVYLGLIEAQLVQGREQEALETYEWYRGAPQRTAADWRLKRSAIDPAMPAPSQLASRLPLGKETVMAYVALPDGLAIWVYDDRGTTLKWVPGPTDALQALAERFHDLASDPKSEISALRRDARSLYGKLLEPVEPRLTPGRTLVIEAEGWLARVPFEALLDANGHYLIERSPIVHSLGQDSEARLRSDSGISPDLPALVVGSTAASPADGLIPLPDVTAEAESVAGRFHHSRLLKGGDATLSGVRSELPAAAVFHFAGHSLAAPERMGLLLEPGSGGANAVRLMDANVVRHLRLERLQLAVLSACSTASGSSGSSGFDSVTDALLRAGVPHVVASRWAVDSGATRGFIQDFYRNALSGQNVSEAIRLTAGNMLADPRTSHPYYWSAFAAYGRP